MRAWIDTDNKANEVDQIRHINSPIGTDQITDPADGDEPAFRVMLNRVTSRTGQDRIYRVKFKTIPYTDTWIHLVNKLHQKIRLICIQLTTAHIRHQKNSCSIGGIGTDVKTGTFLKANGAQKRRALRLKEVELHSGDIMVRMIELYEHFRKATRFYQSPVNSQCSKNHMLTGGVDGLRPALVDFVRVTKHFYAVPERACSEIGR